MLFETFPLGHVTHHRDVDPLLIDDHFAQRHFDREGDVLTCSAESEGAATGAAHKLGPVANDRLRIVFAFVTLGDEPSQIVADHFVVATAEHLFRRRIHRANDTAVVDRDHSVQDVIDHRTNVCFGALEFRKLAAHENKTVAVGNHQKANGNEGKKGERGRSQNPLASGQTCAQFIMTQFVFLEIRQHLADIGHQRFARSDEREDFGIFARAFSIDLWNRRFVNPALDAGANFGQKLGLRWRIRDQNRKVTVVSVKIRDRAFVSFNETVLAGEEIASLLFFHFHDRAVQFGEEVQDLGRLSRPVLIVHALIEYDLLFVLQRLQNFTCLIEESIAERQSSGWVRLALGRSAFGFPAGAHFRSRNRVEPFLNDFLNRYHTLALSRVFQN